MPPRALAIRPYRADDLDATVTLWFRSWSAVFPDLRQPPIAQWKKRFAEEIVPQYAIWTAERAEGIVGFLAIDTVSGYLDQLFVDPNNQRRGVGSALMATAKVLCPAGLRLHVLQENAVALKFYESHGFRFDKTGVNPHNKQAMLEYVWTP